MNFNLFNTYPGHQIIIVFLLVIINSSLLFAQQSKADSLGLLLQNTEGINKMEVLSELVKLHSRKLPEQSIAYGEQLNRLLENNKNDELQSEVWFDLAIANIYLRNFEQSEELLIKTIKLRKKLKNKPGLSTAISQLAYVYYRIGDLNKAYSYIVEAQQMSENSDKQNNKAVDMFRRGVFAKKLGKYEEAIVYYNKAIEVYKILGDEKMVANLLGNIGNVFFNLQHINKALKYNKQALAVYEKMHDSTSIAGSLNDIGNAYYKNNDDSLALKYYFMAYNINKVIGNDIWLAYNMQNIATIYSEQGKYNEAIKYTFQAIALKEKGNNSKSLITSYATLGDIYLLQGNYTEALLKLHKALMLSEESGIRSSLPTIYRKIAKLYSLTNNYDKAYQYQVLYSTEKDTIFKQEKILAINDIQEKYETIEREKEILELQNMQDIQKARETYLIILMIGVFVILVLIIVGVMQKRKKEKQIQRQKDIVHKKENQLVQSELEKSKIKEEELQHSIHYKSKQLSTHALHMMQKNSMLHDMQLDLKTLSKKASTDDKTDFNRINRQINQSLRSQKDWDVFKLYFEDVNKIFYQKLKETNPELTTNDHRLCALIKLNMTSKEMASVLNVAPNSIKSSRYRLKKKLGLDVEADLEEFIRGI